jgi:hypothetical protein
LADTAAADWQVNSGALKRLAQASTGRGGFGALGLNSGEQGAVQGASAGAKAGSLVPIVGTAVGAVVGAIAGYLLSAKHYFNVGNANAQCQQLLQAWQQYTSIQGHVAGRALGWQTMQQLFHAAVGAGLFPGNDMHLSFHQGTLQCAGHGDWVDDFLGVTLQGQGVNACGAHNCMADALAAYNQRRSAVPPGTADAIYFVDDILLPMNASAKIPWVANGAQNPEVHQLFYDLADAYLAQNVSGTTPYVEYPAAQTGTPTAGAVGAAAPVQPAAAPVQSAPVPTTAPGAPAQPAVTVPYVSPTSTNTQQFVAPAASTPVAAPQPPLTVTGTTSAGTPVVPTDQTTGLIQSLLAQGQSQQQAFESALASLQANGVNTQSPQVQQQVAGAVAAAAPVSASSLLSGPTGLILIALGLGGAILLGMRGKRT